MSETARIIQFPASRIGVKILVCGSRNWEDMWMVRMALARYANAAEPVDVIHGAARGADRIAGIVAEDFGFSVREFPADWDRHGHAAGPIRNRQMLDEEPHIVIAFVMPGSRGAWDTVNEARRRGIPVEVYTP